MEISSQYFLLSFSVTITDLVSLAHLLSANNVSREIEVMMYDLQ
jgi:hypothetical protein